MKETQDHYASDVLDVAFVFDTRYAIPTLVALASLLRNKAPSTRYRIFCVTSEPVRDWDRFVEVVSRTPDASITRIDPGPDLEALSLIRRRAGTVAHVPSIALAKMLLPWILPSAADRRRILYLDCDMIVLDDLGALRDLDLEDRPLGAVRDNGALFKKAAHIEWNPDYFNSGLLLIEPAKWTASNKLEDLSEAIRRDDLHRYLDQDAFNVAFRDQVRLLPPRYNVIVPTLDKLSTKGPSEFNSRFGTSYDSAESLADDAAVLHYAGTGFKPWRNPSRFLSDRWWEEYEAAGLRAISATTND